MNAKDLEQIRALIRDEIAATHAPVTVAPAKQTVSPYVDAPKGERQRATREYNRANKVAGKFCPACDAGFAFAKVNCPRCGAAL